MYDRELLMMFEDSGNLYDVPICTGNEYFESGLCVEGLPKEYSAVQNDDSCSSCDDDIDYDTFGGLISYSYCFGVQFVPSDYTEDGSTSDWTDF